MTPAFFQLIAEIRDLQNLMITMKRAEIIIDRLKITEDFTNNLDFSTAIQFTFAYEHTFESRARAVKNEVIRQWRATFSSRDPARAGAPKWPRSQAQFSAKLCSFFVNGPDST